MPRQTATKAFRDEIQGVVQLNASEAEKEHFERLVAEQAKRKIEALKLYEPNDLQKTFHASLAKERLLQAGNQFGKSLAGFVEDARAVTGQDPHGKYPATDGVLVCIGLDEQHIGRNIYKYLFKPGAFKIIRDLETREWRSWKPWIPEDVERKKEAKPAPPLVPARFVKQINWRKAGQKIFQSVDLHNGWQILAFGSKGEPAAGFQADLVHIDEDIDRADWYDEMIARLTIREGRLIWTALPLARNEALVNVAQRAEEEEGADNPSTICIRATIFDNPYITEQTRQENIKRWKAKGDDEYRKRALGELTISGRLMYPSFEKDIHNATRHDGGAHNIQRYLFNENGNPGRDWCRYMIVDPGHTVCAVVFFAVPPPKRFGNFVIAYDECYIHQCDPEKFANHVKAKAVDNYFEAFIMDAHGGRLRSIAGGKLPKTQYSEALKKVEIRSGKTKFGFLDGCDDIAYRENALRSWLTIRDNGFPTLLISPRCQNTLTEIPKFRKKIDAQGRVLDEGNRRFNTHAIECLEYGAAHGLPYVRPKKRKRYSSVVSRIISSRKTREKQRTAQRRGANPFITLGPRGS